MSVIPPAISNQSIPCRIGETVHLYDTDQTSYLCVDDLHHCISIGFIGKNKRKSLSACPCLVFFSKSGRVKFFADDYLVALIKRETTWLGEVERVEIRASYKNPHSAWYLCHAENFFRNLGFEVLADFSPVDKHILGLENMPEQACDPVPENKNNNQRDNICFSEFLLKFLILGVDNCLPVVKYDKMWLDSSGWSKFFLEHLNLSYLLSKSVLNTFIEKYKLEDDQQIIASMIRRNFKVFMHSHSVLN